MVKFFITLLAGKIGSITFYEISDSAYNAGDLYQIITLHTCLPCMAGVSQGAFVDIFPCIRTKARITKSEISMRTWRSPMSATSQGAFVVIPEILLCDISYIKNIGCVSAR